tara:strand:+ start:22 stop:960 length:939 start_codon:yes stop_codon:yes gene_type:complete
VKYNKVLVTGGSGLLGTALKQVSPSWKFISSKDVDLKNFAETVSYFKDFRPDAVIHLAGKVGGLGSNMNNLGSFFYENVTINVNVLEASRLSGATKVMSIMSTCVYPDEVSYPLTESDIHNGEPHPSNYAYAYAKRMLDVQSRAYRDQYGLNYVTVIPNNLFGINDNFDLDDSHVLPALIRKFYEAKIFGKEVALWGDGSPLREFTFSIDAAKILVFLLHNYDSREPINIGNTKEFSIKEVAELISNIYEYEKQIIWDSSKPSGQFRKPSSSKKLTSLGWSPEKYTEFTKALETVCDWFSKNYTNARGVEKK